MNPWLTPIRPALVAILLVGALVAPTAGAFAQQAEYQGAQPAYSNLQPIRDDDLLVLEVRLERRSTGHGLLAYKPDETILLPLGELCSILELAIMVDPLAGKAEGWIIDEERTFALDLANRTVTRQGKLSPLPPASVGVDDHDIYIDHQLLAQWFPVELDINLPRMHVNIKPRETLPFQSRLKRDEQRSRWLISRGKANLDYPLRRSPYRLWSWPQVDATLGFYTPEYSATRRFSLQSNCDLANLSTNLFVSHAGNDERSQTNARLKAGRWDPDGGLFGPLHATRYEFGDLFINPIPLITTRKQGLGFTVSNQTLHRNREFDTTEIQGNVPPGWEVELYINGSLYDFQIVGEDAQYIFQDVPLIVGNNIFRAVLYGPQGEIREVVERANIRPEMSAVGQLKYTATVVRDDEMLLMDSPQSTEGSAGTWNQQLELAYAFGKKHAMVANVSRLELPEGPQVFSSLSSHDSFGPVYLNTVLAKGLEEGTALSFGARTKLGSHNLSLRHEFNENYRAEAPENQRYIRQQTHLRSSGALTPPLGRGLYYSMSASRRAFAQSELNYEREGQFQLSSSLKRLLVSHNFRYRLRESETTRNEEYFGTVLARTLLGPISVRADLNYELSPNQARSASATFSWHQTEKYRANVRATHFFRPEFGEDNLGVQLNRFFSAFSVGLNFSYFQDSGPAAGIIFGTYFTRDVYSNRWTAQHRPQANRAVASVRAFIDHNGTGVFDEGDEPLEGVGFRNLAVWRKIRTGRDGIALLPGLLVHQTQTIELDLATVADPYLIPLTRGVNVVGHPGSFVRVDFPFTYAGEIEGMILDSSRPDQPVRHVGLELLDDQGNRVASTVGEFDGYYYFPDIYPGTYELRVIPSTVNSSLFEIPAATTVTVSGAGGFIVGPDIVLVRKEVIPTVTDLVEEESAAQTQETREGEKDSPADTPETPDLPEEQSQVGPGEIAAAGSGELADERSDEITYNEEMTLSLIYEMLYQNSLWPEATQE